jgi:hypothetical protein
VELAAFFVASPLAAALGAEHETNDDVGEGLRQGDARIEQNPSTRKVAGAAT